MHHLHPIQLSGNSNPKDSFNTNDQPLLYTCYDEEETSSRSSNNRGVKQEDAQNYFLMSERLNSQQEVVAALKKELQEARDEIDQDYAIAVTLVAKERDAFHSRIEGLVEERDRLAACATLQQVHIDALTKEFVDLQEENERLLLKGTTKRTKTSETNRPEVIIGIEKHLELILHGMDEFKAFFRIWLKSRQGRTIEVVEQEDEADSRDDDGLMELEIAFDAFQKTIEGHSSALEQASFVKEEVTFDAFQKTIEGHHVVSIHQDDTVCSDERDYSISIDTDDSLTMKATSSFGINEIEVLLTEEEKRARRRSTSSALKQASLIKEVVRRRKSSFLESWVFGIDNTEGQQDLIEDLLYLKKESDLAAKLYSGKCP